MALLISSCKNDDKKSIGKEIFIVSKFNNDIKKRFEDARLKDPELSKIKAIQEFDYPKGIINFIILKDGKIFYYNEKLIWNWCGWHSDKAEVVKRELSNDNLHQISYDQIYSLLKDKSVEEKMKDHHGELHTLSFSFETDTIKSYDVYKLLQDIDSLGFHSYTIRKIAPFESDAIGKIK